MINISHTCRGCGGQFLGRKRKYCTRKCGIRSYNFQKCRKQGRQLRSDITANAGCNKIHKCRWCDKEFQPKRAGRTQYCSRECCFEFRAVKSELITEMSASHKVHRAKCVNCGCRFDASVGAMYCSLKCRNMVYSISGFNSVEFSCRECGEHVQTSHGQSRRSFCSDTCSKRNSRRIRRKMERARLREVQVEPVDPIKVFNRDGWRCQICGVKTPRSKRGSITSRAPELDHIVPLSVGGEHSYKNTQCACRECNGKKGNKVYGQIPMFTT